MREEGALERQKNARLPLEKYFPCMAFFFTTKILGQKPPIGLSAAQRRATGCRRVDEPTSVRKFRVVPRAP
jgi:hypothetical protein